jgi:hypothetical protein
MHNPVHTYRKVEEQFRNLEWCEGDWEIKSSMPLFWKRFYIYQQGECVQTANSLLAAILWVESRQNETINEATT